MKLLGTSDTWTDIRSICRLIWIATDLGVILDHYYHYQWSTGCLSARVPMRPIAHCDVQMCGWAVRECQSSLWLKGNADPLVSHDKSHGRCSNCHVHTKTRPSNWIPEWTNISETVFEFWFLTVTLIAPFRLPCEHTIDLFSVFVHTNASDNRGIMLRLFVKSVKNWQRNIFFFTIQLHLIKE